MLTGYQSSYKAAKTIISQRNEDTERSRKLHKVTEVLKERQGLDGGSHGGWGGREQAGKADGRWAHSPAAQKLRNSKPPPASWGHHPEKGSGVAPE